MSTKPRESTLIDKSTFDDPSDSCLAGSNEEFDLLCEWSRDELVETIQALEQKLAVAVGALKHLADDSIDGYCGFQMKWVCYRPHMVAQEALALINPAKGDV